MVKPRLAVVTGANRGLGLETARQLVARGLEVIATGRDPKEADKAARSVGAKAFTLDVTNKEQIEALAAHVSGGLDVLVNNAGVLFDGFDAGIARRTLDVNFHGAMHLTDRLLPRIRPGGRIVMVSSGLGELSCLSRPLAAKLDSPTLDRAGLLGLMESYLGDVAAGVHRKNGWAASAYSVSKVALNALTRVLARELAGDPRKILVNAACPGWVRTRMGGSGAPRTVEEGATTSVFLALLPEGGPTGGFFREEQPVPW